MGWDVKVPEKATMAINQYIIGSGMWMYCAGEIYAYGNRT